MNANESQQEQASAQNETVAVELTYDRHACLDSARIVGAVLAVDLEHFDQAILSGVPVKRFVLTHAADGDAPAEASNDGAELWLRNYGFKAAPGMIVEASPAEGDEPVSLRLTVDLPRDVVPAPEPVVVTVFATDACYPTECKTSGVLLADGRVLIDYPFVWTSGGDNAADPGAQIDMSHLVLADGTEIQEGWREVSVKDLSAAELESVLACKSEATRVAVEALAKAVAILEQLQAEPGKAADIIRQGYFGHALVRGRRVLGQAGK